MKIFVFLCILTIIILIIYEEYHTVFKTIIISSLCFTKTHSIKQNIFFFIWGCEYGKTNIMLKLNDILIIHNVYIRST